MNKIILMGNLTKDPEIRYTQSAEPMAVAKFGLAVRRKFKRDNDPEADFFNCTAFGKLAEFSEKFLKKGLKIAVSGRVQFSTSEDASGQRRWFTDVILEEIDFAESKSSFESRAGSQGGGGYQPQKSSQMNNAYEPEGFSAITESIDDDDLPF